VANHIIFFTSTDGKVKVAESDFEGKRGEVSGTFSTSNESEKECRRVDTLLLPDRTESTLVDLDIEAFDELVC
jgi:hypothetical protein